MSEVLGTKEKKPFPAKEVEKKAARDWVTKYPYVNGCWRTILNRALIKFDDMITEDEFTKSCKKTLADCEYNEMLEKAVI